MKLTGNKLSVDFSIQLFMSGNMVVTGGSTVQFFDGNNYYPNRSGSPASPIIIEHEVNFVDPDGRITNFPYETLFYKNNSLVTSSTSGYELLGNNELKVVKNIPHGEAVAIRAVSKYLDTRSGAVYEREDVTYLRTILKAEAPYQVELLPSGRQYFDGYRNPNTKTDVTAVVKLDGENISSYSGITFKWLNADGDDCIDNELYGDKYSNGNRTFTVDKTYIDNETIRCEAWKDGKLLGFDSVTFVRKFNSYRTEVRIPELPITGGTSHLNCSLILTDMKGDIDVDAAFLVDWYVKEGSRERVIGSGASTRVPVSSINLTASNLEIYPDVRRREAWAALIDDDDFILTDDDDNVLTVETYGN